MYDMLFGKGMEEHQFVVDWMSVAQLADTGTTYREMAQDLFSKNGIKRIVMVDSSGKYLGMPSYDKWMRVLDSAIDLDSPIGLD